MYSFLQCVNTEAAVVIYPTPSRGCPQPVLMGVASPAIIDGCGLSSLYWWVWPL